MTTRPDLATRIRHLRTPREALDEAGRLRRFQRPDWFDVNIGIMDDILYAKFTQHPELKESLLDTDNSELIEDSPVRSVCNDGSVVLMLMWIWVRSTRSGAVEGMGKAVMSWGKL